MYERAKRDLLSLNKDQLNPNLGPGTYAQDTGFDGQTRKTGKYAALASKRRGGRVEARSGFAPFNSLEIRKSIFDEPNFQKATPSPLAYNPRINFLVRPCSKAAAAGTGNGAFFLRSRAPRFCEQKSDMPAPNVYTLGSTLQAAPNPKLLEKHAHRNQRLHSRSACARIASVSRSALAAVPQPQEQIEQAKEKRRTRHLLETEGLPLVDSSDETGKTSEERLRQALEGQPGNDYLVDMANPNIHGRFKTSKRLLIVSKQQLIEDNKTETRVASGNSQLRSPRSQARHARAKIQWRRKFHPPSIPIGPCLAGYTEDGEGNICAIRAQSLSTSCGSILSPFNVQASLVARAKHDKKGFTFGHGERTLRLNLGTAGSTIPAPGQYDLQKSEKHLGSGAPSVSIGSAPCVRITDSLMDSAKKQGVPGPGAYDPAASLEKPVETASRPSLKTLGGAERGDRQPTYVPKGLLENPGPGTYSASANTESGCRRIPAKSYAFGATAARFDSTAEKVAQQVPPPGVYDVSASTLERGNTLSWKPPSELEEKIGRLRLVEKERESMPSPAEYVGVITEAQSQEQRLRRCVNPVFENAKLLEEKVHKRVFNTSASRFKSLNDGDIPSPAMYDAASAHKSLISAGQVPVVGPFRSRAARGTRFDERGKFSTLCTLEAAKQSSPHYGDTLSLSLRICIAF